MAIGVLDFHFVSPLIVRRRMAEFGPASFVLLIQCCDIPDSDPYPRPGLPLATAAQVYSGGVAVHGSELVIPPGRVLETQHVDVVGNADRHIRDVQDWSTVFKVG